MQFVKRKWGWYLTLIDADYFKVKILRFRKNSECSNQYHNHRNELWLFLKGTGRFNGKSVFGGGWEQVAKRESHQYKAIETTYVLEIQYGATCEEMDIVRL